MSNNLRHRNCNTENCVLIKMPSYLVTMMIAKFLHAKLNRVIQEELVDTKYTDFEEGLTSLLFLQNVTV